MALQSLNTPIAWPGWTLGLPNIPASANGSTLDAAGEYEAIVMQATKAMAISHIAFRAASVSGSPTADVRIETVDASGNPSGTLFATNTNVVTATLTNAWAAHALTATANVVAGDMFAVKVAYNSGTSFLTRTTNNLGSARSVLPAQVTSLGGSTTRAAIIANMHQIVVGSSSTAFYSLPGLNPAESVAANTFNNTNTAARGVRFQVPFTCRCVGIRHHLNAATGDFAFVLYDDAGSELSSSSTTMDGDNPVAAATAMANMFFDNPVTLSVGTQYRAAIVPSSATNSSITVITLPTLNYRSAMPGGTNFYYVTRASGTWDDTNTTMVPVMDLLLDQLDDGAGSGGASKGKLTGLLG